MKPSRLLPARSRPSRHREPCVICQAIPTRLYPCGRRCRLHIPAAMAGHPEPPNTPPAPIAGGVG